MALGRSKCVIGDMSPKKVISHDVFVSRIRKTLYYGRRTSYKGMAISRPLAVYASELFSEPHKGYSLNRLTEEVAGGMNAASPCALIMALIYLDRLNASDPAYVRRILPSELFIVSLVISTKFYWEIDEQLYLKTCAKESNISEERIKALEMQFLFAIDWNIYISEDEFFDKLETVERTVARREGIKRGWLTYTELKHFLPSFTIVKFLINNIAVLTVSYAASVMTIAGAFFLVNHISGTTLSQVSTETQLKTNESLDTRIISDTLHTSVEVEIDQTTSPCSVTDIEEEMKKLELEYNTVQSATIQSNHNGKTTSSADITIGKRTNADFADLSACNAYSEKDYCDDWKNGTDSFFWSLLQNTDKTFVRLPLIWFKFI